MDGDLTRKRRREILRDAAFGCLVGLSVIVLSRWSEHGPLGRAARAFFEQGSLLFSQRLDASQLPVAVINLHGFPKHAQVRCRLGTQVRWLEPLDRNALYDAIEAVVKFSPSPPYSVGVDADFAPCDDGPILSDADTRFFDRLLALERGVYGAPADAQGAHHIVLGTFRREAYDPATWLGDDRYAGLAGDMGIPSAEPWRAVSWIGGSEVTRRGYSLAARLAFPDGTQGDRDGWSWLRTPEDLFVAEGRADVAATPVDLITLSKITVLDPLEPDRAAVSLRDLAKAGRFSKQIVLFGIVAQRADGTYLDGHLVPGFGDQPGVKIHAAAAYSLRSARLYDLTWLCKTVLDVLCFAVLIGFVGFVRWHYAGSTRAVDAHRFTRIVGVLLAIVLVGTAMLLFGAVRVMWDDALLVAAFVAAHPFMERFYAGAATKTRRSCASLWNWALSGSNEG